MQGKSFDEFKREMATPPEAEAETLKLAQMDGCYSTMRPTNKEIPRLHVIDKKGMVQSFQYCYLDARSSFEGGCFTFVFAGSKHWQLKVEGHGKDLFRIYDYITLKRWPYLRVVTRDFGQDETVFTSIEIKDVTPPV